MTAKPHRATTWPLLRKDLTEMAAQGRGYWLRAGVVALGYAGFVWLYHELGQNLRSGGRESFELLNGFMAGAVTLFTPLVIASAIAGEKERSAFGLLLVTPLTCWELLLEKFVARLVPLAGMMLCTLPLYAVCYSHGGVEPATLVGVAGLQLANLLQAGAVGLCMSCRFQSTLTAVLMSWLFWGVLLVAAIVMDMARWDEDLALGIFGFYHAVEAKFYPTFTDDLWRFACLLGPALLLLLAARFFLLRHAFRKAGNRRLSLVRWLHRRLDWMTGRLRGGSMLPGKEAFSWRELHRLGIATFRFKVRLAVAAFLASFAASLVVLLVELNGATEIYFGMHVGIWIIMAIAATMFGVSAAQAEAKNRTAETLAVTPDGIAHALSARMSALTILSLLLFPALLVLPGTGLLLLEYLLRPWSQALIQLAAYILPIAATFLVLPFFFLRYGMWFGTVFKGSARALAVAVIAALVWFIGAEYAGAKAYDYFEDKSYVLSPGGYNVDISAESLRLLEWFASARGIASPAALPVKILQREDAVHPATTGIFTALYLSLGMLLQHRTLHRVRKRYG